MHDEGWCCDSEGEDWQDCYGAITQKPLEINSTGHSKQGESKCVATFEHPQVTRSLDLPPLTAPCAQPMSISIPTRIEVDNEQVPPPPSADELMEYYSSFAPPPGLPPLIPGIAPLINCPKAPPATYNIMLRGPRMTLHSPKTSLFLAGPPKAPPAHTIHQYPFFYHIPLSVPCSTAFMKATVSLSSSSPNTISLEPILPEEEASATCCSKEKVGTVRSGSEQLQSAILRNRLLPDSSCHLGTGQTPLPGEVPFNDYSVEPCDDECTHGMGVWV